MIARWLGLIWVKKREKGCIYVAICAFFIHLFSEERILSTQMRLVSFMDILRDEIVSKRLTKAEISRRYGVNRRTLDNWLMGVSSPDLKRVTAILDDLGLVSVVMSGRVVGAMRALVDEDNGMLYVDKRNKVDTPTGE